MKRIKGFTLIELMVAIILIGILSLVGVVTYRGYRQSVIETEAKMMLGKLHEAQQVYYVRNKTYYDSGSLTASDSNLGVDFRRNKYYTGFKYFGSSNLSSEVSYQTNGYKGVTYEITIKQTEAPTISKV